MPKQPYLGGTICDLFLDAIYLILYESMLMLDNLVVINVVMGRKNKLFKF
jgi:hypothetical protein